VSRNLRGLLERGVQKTMDPEEPKGPVDPSAPPLAIEAMLGYTRAVGTALWHETEEGTVERWSEARPSEMILNL
jgi:hypothetical protein